MNSKNPPYSPELKKMKMKNARYTTEKLDENLRENNLTGYDKSFKTESHNNHHSFGKTHNNNFTSRNKNIIGSSLYQIKENKFNYKIENENFKTKNSNKINRYSEKVNGNSNIPNDYIPFGFLRELQIKYKS